MKKIAFFSFLFLFCIHINMYAQNFLKHYTFRYNSASLVESPVRFSSITSRMDNGNLLVTGSATNAENITEHALVILEVEPDGDSPLSNWHVIEIGDATQTVHPMGIIFETFSHSDNAIVAGYLSNGTDSSAFVLRYNLGTKSVVWVNTLTAPISSCFFDIDYFNSTSWVVCGHYNNASDAMIYSVNKNTGAFTEVYQAEGSASSSSDTYFALNYNSSNNLLASVARLTFGLYYTKMRPVLTINNLLAPSITSDYYVTDLSHDARLYAMDVARRGDNNYSIVINGDRDGDGGGAVGPVFQDMFILRTDAAGNLNWGRRLEATSTANDCEGILNSVKIAQGTFFPATNYNVVFGTTCNTSLGPSFIAVLNTNASIVNWSLQYPGLTPYRTICPNSMITDNENDVIYAVGYSLSDGLSVGAIIKTTFTDGLIADVPDPEFSECNVAYDLGIFNSPFASPKSLTSPENEITTSSPTTEKVPSSVQIALICENELKTSSVIENNESLIISAIDANTVEFYLSGDESDEQYTLQVYNIVGQLVSSNTIVAGGTVTNRYTPGVYIYQLLNGNAVIDNAKFVVR